MCIYLPLLKKECHFKLLSINGLKKPQDKHLDIYVTMF